MNELREIKTIIEKYPNHYSRVLRKYPKLINWIYNNTSFLTECDYSIPSRIYCIINHYKSSPKCVVCGKPILKDVDNLHAGFAQTCCKECRYKNPNRFIKAKKTCLEKYGVENPYQSEEIKKKIAKTTLERYGNEHFCRTKEYLVKTKETCQQKYGTDTPVTLESREKSNKTYRAKRFDKLNKSTLIIPKFTKDQFVNEDNIKHIWQWHCNKCNRDFETPINRNETHFIDGEVRCIHCHPHYVGTSKAEQEIASFIRSIYSGEIIQNDRTLIAPKEVDIYIPEKKAAIEYDGLFYHSTYFDRNPNTMVNKTNICESKGVKLLHIFEDEWLDSRPIVEGYIKETLKLYDHVYKYDPKIDTIKQIFQDDIIDFMQATHLQGYATADLHLGLFRNGELLCSLSFNKLNSINENIFELVRICYEHENDCSDLLKHLLIDFENHFRPTKIIHYADRRFVNDYSYLGFVDTKIKSKPHSFFIKDQIRFSRADYMDLPVLCFDSSDPDGLKREDVYEVYDCGYARFEKAI